MRLLRVLIALLAVGGAFVSFLALRVHLQDPSAAPPCAVTEHWDCGTVNHSRFAVFPARSFDEDPHSPGHIPVAAIGIAGYLLIGIVALAGADFWTWELSQLGLVAALGFTFIEKYVLEKWCIYCVWSQSIMAVLFAVACINLLVSRRHRARAGLHLRAV